MQLYQPPRKLCQPRQDFTRFVSDMAAPVARVQMLAEMVARADQYGSIVHIYPMIANAQDCILDLVEHANPSVLFENSNRLAKICVVYNVMQSLPTVMITLYDCVLKLYQPLNFTNLRKELTCARSDLHQPLIFTNLQTSPTSTGAVHKDINAPQRQI